jgi:hypothetical protein
MPADSDFLRGAGDEIQFVKVGAKRTLGGCSYNTTAVRATAFLPALCQLILDFITFRADRRVMQHPSVGRYGEKTRHS